MSNIEVLEAKKKEMQAVYFPWPEMREFVSLLISQMLAQQGVMVGERMLAAGAPGVTEEELEKVRQQFNHIKLACDNANTIVEQTLASWEGRGPKILMPRH